MIIGKIIKQLKSNIIATFIHPEYNNKQSYLIKIIYFFFIVT